MTIWQRITAAATCLLLLLLLAPMSPAEQNDDAEKEEQKEAESEPSQAGDEDAESGEDDEDEVSPFELSAEAFFESNEANQPINRKHVDATLLSAATFHATNIQRMEHELEALGHLPELDEASRLQAVYLVQRQELSHTNEDEKDLHEPIDRVKHVGLKPRFVAENVATEFAIQYEAGKTYYHRGRRFSYAPRGPAIPPHTYRTFAEALLRLWMDSPGHRENILHPDARFVGCAAVLDEKLPPGDIPKFYAAQVFFTPRLSR